MNRKFKVLVTFIVAILLVTGLYIFTDWFSKITGYFAGEDEKTNLAQCLDEKGAEFYSSLYSPESEKQTKLFGASFKFISSIECGKNKELCPNIKSVPAWYINKTIYYGMKNLTELDELSGCNVIG